MLDLDLSKTVYERINSEEFLMIASGEYNDIYLIQLKKEKDSFIMEFVHKLISRPNRYEVKGFEIIPLLKDRGSSKSLRVNPYLIVWKDRVLIYDATLRRFLYSDIYFDKAYLKESDLYETEDNLVREEEGNRFNDYFVLRLRNESSDSVYPVFIRTGRLKTIYRSLNAVRNVSMRDISDGPFSEGISEYKIFEDSISGDEEELQYIYDKMNFNYKNNKGNIFREGIEVIYSLQKKN